MTLDPILLYSVPLAVTLLNRLAVETHSQVLEERARRSALANLQQILAALDLRQLHSAAAKDPSLVAALLSRHFQNQTVEIGGSRMPMTPK